MHRLIQYLQPFAWSKPLEQIHFHTSDTDIVRIRPDWQQILYCEHRQKTEAFGTPVNVQHTRHDAIHTVARVEYATVINLATDGPILRFDPNYECRALQFNRFSRWLDPGAPPEDTTMLIRCVQKTDLAKPPCSDEIGFVERLASNYLSAYPWIQRRTYWTTLNMAADLPKPEETRCSSDNHTSLQSCLFLDIDRFSRQPGITPIGGRATFCDGTEAALVTQMDKRKEEAYAREQAWFKAQEASEN